MPSAAPVCSSPAAASTPAGSAATAAADADVRSHASAPRHEAIRGAYAGAVRNPTLGCVPGSR